MSQGASQLAYDDIDEDRSELAEGEWNYGGDDETIPPDLVEEDPLPDDFEIKKILSYQIAEEDDTLWFDCILKP